MSKSDLMPVFIALSVALFPSPLTAQQDHLVDLGSHALHAVVSGAGSPVVVLESGLGLGVETWDPVRERIAEFTTVIAYSRAGYGRSGESGAPRTPTQISIELASLLDGLGVEGRVVLVGHSLGGLYARTFAAQFPERTAGIVLVDSSHERQTHEMSFLSATLFEDTRRGLAEYAESQGGGTGPEVEEWWPILNRGTAAEAYPLPEVPTVVITAQLPDERYVAASAPALDVIRRLHREFLDFSPDARQVLVPESGHMVHKEAPSLVVEIVHSVVREVRGGT